MEKFRQWIQTLALAALALAAASYALQPGGAARASVRGSATCQAFIPPEGVSELSVSDPIRIWMNQQIDDGRDEFVVVNRGPDNRASLLCAW